MNIGEIKSELGVSTIKFSELGEWLVEWNGDTCITTHSDVASVITTSDNLFVKSVDKTDKKGNAYTLKIICEGTEKEIVLEV